MAQEQDQLIQGLKDLLLDLQVSFYEAEGWLVNMYVYPEVGRSIWQRWQSAGLLPLDGSEQQVLDQLGLLIKKAGLVKDIRSTLTSKTACKVEIEGCALADIEHGLNSKQITPCLCPIINLVAITLEAKLGVFAERLDHQMGDAVCSHNLTLFAMKEHMNFQEVISGAPFDFKVGI